MISMLRQWNGPCEVNGQRYDSIDAFISQNKTLSGAVDIKLLSVSVKCNTERPTKPGTASERPAKHVSEEPVYRITVKKYMTEKSSDGFDFMLKWNNDNPMPLRTMEGTVLQETKGMVKMHLRGFGEATCNCMRCGRNLTNPISRHYGIGPECMSKLGLVRDIEDVEGIKEDLVKLEWEGWVIKSAITEKETV